MLISVQSKKREVNGDVVATILDGRGGTEEVHLTGADAAEVERVWMQNQFDLDRYARFPAEFPAPASIPVEISDRD